MRQSKLNESDENTYLLPGIEQQRRNLPSSSAKSRQNEKIKLSRPLSEARLLFLSRNKMDLVFERHDDALSVLHDNVAVRALDVTDECPKYLFLVSLMKRVGLCGNKTSVICGCKRPDVLPNAPRADGPLELKTETNYSMRYALISRWNDKIASEKPSHCNQQQLERRDLTVCRLFYQ